MNEEESRELLSNELSGFEAQSHSELQKRIGEIYTNEVTGKSGHAYQIEIEVRWDQNADEGTIRIVGSISDGRLLSLKSYIPTTLSLLKRP